MGVPTIKTGPMTVQEFYAFTDTRPDGEKWELIDGEPILNASSSKLHQRIVKNLGFVLATLERRPGTIWEMLPGLGVRVSDTSRPEPDLLIIPMSGDSADSQGRDRDDVIVAFEVLSPSTASRDLRWKRTAYTSLPTLTHYIVIAQDAVDVVVFSREDGFADHRLRSLSGSIELRSLGISVPLSEIYRNTGLK
ncbi:MAG: Uma2 family endonuclease [Xanthobacteraceae bacterium]